MLNTGHVGMTTNKREFLKHETRTFNFTGYSHLHAYTSLYTQVYLYTHKYISLYTNISLFTQIHL